MADPFFLNSFVPLQGVAEILEIPEIKKILKVDYPRGKPGGILPTLFRQKS